MVVPLPDDAVSYVTDRWALFGKLPAHGDFVSRGLDPAARDRLDHWLSAAMMQAQEVYGAAFEERFDRAGPWRFAVERGDGWAAGALAMSADAAGRRFPLYGEWTGLAVGDRAVATAGRVETALYRAIAEGLGVETAMTVMAANDDDAAIAADAAPGWRDMTGAIACTDARPADIVARMLAEPAGAADGAGAWA